MSAARVYRLSGALAALAAAAAIGACGSDGDGGEQASPSGDPGSVGKKMTQTIPAQIVHRPQGFVSGDVVRPLQNGWRAASHTSFTEVDAGALARDPRVGAFAIFRHEFVAARQTVDIVEVPDAGTLRITSAPEGGGVVESAQKRGRIEFLGRGGVRGTLDLSDDSVRLEGK
jgi:hypothetical protein